jgi:hypothetical protein
MDPHGLPAWLLAGAAGVSLATAQRWKRFGRIPPLPARLVALAIGGELGVLSPAWRGFTLRDGRLWTPYGFGVTPNEISALAYRFAQLRALERERAEPHQRPLFG